MSSMPWRTLAALAGVGVALLAFGEVQAWRVSRDDYPAATTAGPATPDGATPGPATPDRAAPNPTVGRDVVLVLGFRSRDDGRLNALQAWRTRIAVRSAPRGALFVFSGAAVRGTEPEAEVMARYGVSRLGIHPGDIAIEPTATTTRENLSLSLPWLQDARTIRIASNTAHARRARRYLRELDPALWHRLRRTRDFVLLELGPLRLALTFYDFIAGRTAGRREAELAAMRPA